MIKKRIKNLKEVIRLIKKIFSYDFKKLKEYKDKMNKEKDKEKQYEYKAKYYNVKREIFHNLFMYSIEPGLLCLFILAVVSAPQIGHALAFAVRGIDCNVFAESMDFYKVMIPATILTFGGPMACIPISYMYSDKSGKYYDRLHEIREEKLEESKKEKEKQKILEESKEQVIEKSIGDKKEELIALKDELLSLKQDKNEEKAIVLVKK